MFNRWTWYVDNIRVTGNGDTYDNYMDSYAEITVNLDGLTTASLEFYLWMDAEDKWDWLNVSGQLPSGDWSDTLEISSWTSAPAPSSRTLRRASRLPSSGQARRG